MITTLRSLMADILMLVALITVPVTALAFDTTQPVTAATLSGAKGADGWYTTSVTVTLAATDGEGGSGVAKTEYSLDTVTWQSYSIPFILEKDGTQYVYFRSTDLAGNVEAPAKSQEIKINKTGLVGLWHMDGDWKDSSVVGNNGTPYNGVTFSTSAKAGTYAGSFDGGNDYVNIANSPALNTTGAISISFWMMPAAWGNGKSAGIVSKKDNDSSRGYVIYNDGVYPGKINFRLKGLSGSYQYFTSNANVDLGIWQHWVATYDPATLEARWYKNGILDRSFSGITIGDMTSTAALQVGRSQTWGGFFSGLLDEISIYSRALSATEIQELYRKHVVNYPTVNPVTSPTTTATIVLNGTKPANTAIVVNGNTLVPLDEKTSWQTNYTLSQGMNTISITALDSRQLNSLPVVLSVVLDSIPPVAPGIEPFTTINTTSKTITGTRSSDSASVVVSCAGTTIDTISYPTTTTWSVNVSGLHEGSNLVTVYAVDAVGNQSAATTATITVDTTPPAAAATPVGGIYKLTQSVVLVASEQSVIYYSMDGSTPTASDTRYSQPILITASATLKYFARDLAGNDSEIQTENYVVDAAPPVLEISTLSNNAYTNNETLNIAGAVTDASGVKEITINDDAVPVNTDGSFSYALLLRNGVNSINIAATDIAGNTAVDTRTVTLDQTVPVLTATAPADNSKTARMLLEVNGTVDETSTVTVKSKEIIQSALMNDGAFTATITLEPGYNTIEITAIDLAGNQSSLKRTVVFDDQVPSLAVTMPSQDIRTNQSSLTIQGTVADSLTAVGVTISKDNEVLTPPVTDGTFQQALNFTEEKTYGIVITATNEAGTSASVQRNVIYDITPPVLSMDPIPSPTNQTSQSVSGTREAGAAVTVDCATATVGEVLYPTATTWQVEISGLHEGENVISASSADAAGNMVTATTTVVFSSEPAEITITATPNVIWPPNHKMVPVTIAGGVKANGSDIKSISISVSDEYRKYKYNNLTFGSTVMLEAWRKGNDQDGRKYTITVVVTDKGGKTTTQTETVIVPLKAPSQNK